MKKCLPFQTSHENVTIKNLPGIFLIGFIFFLFFTQFAGNPDVYIGHFLLLFFMVRTLLTSK